MFGGVFSKQLWYSAVHCSTVFNISLDAWNYNYGVLYTDIKYCHGTVGYLVVALRYGTILEVLGYRKLMDTYISIIFQGTVWYTVASRYGTKF